MLDQPKKQLQSQFDELSSSFSRERDLFNQAIQELEQKVAETEEKLEGRAQNCAELEHKLQLQLNELSKVMIASRCFSPVPANLTM